VTDLDQLLHDAASDTRRWSADSPVAIETIEGRAHRRRAARVASAGATALVALVIAAVVTTTGSSDRDASRVAVSVAAEPPPVVRTATPDDVHAASANGQVRVEGLPTEGIAVEDGDAVLLLSTDGTVLERLAGFRVHEGTYVADHGALVLYGPDGTVYELDALAGVLAPRPRGDEGTVPLSYGARFVRTGSGGGNVQRDGHTLFTIDGSNAATHLSWDRDIVTRVPFEPTTASVAFDLRTTTARPLPAGCRVADRHGPAWFLLCPWEGAALSVVRLDPDGSTTVLAESTPGASWDDAMVSPDGRRLLAYACGFPTVSFGSTSTGVGEGYDLDVAAIDPAPLGWTAGGEAILHAANGCGITTSEQRGVFAFDGETLRPISVASGAAVMWTPLLGRK